MSNSTKAPFWLILVGILALLWNLMGLFVFYTGMTMTTEGLAEVPERMHGFYADTVPWWYWTGFGMAVIAGVLGCILLILKKRLSTFMFSISIIGMFMMNIWTFFISDIPEVMIGQDYMMPTLVLAIGILLLFLSKRAEREGWIH